MSVEEQLRILGIRKPPDVVRRVVRRLHQGQSLYPLYTGYPPFLSKTTALDFKKRYQEGQLDFLLQEIEPTELVDRLYPVTEESYVQRVERELEQDRDDQQEVREALKQIPSRPSDRDGLGYHRMEVIDGLPTVDWSILGLERAHISKEIALSLLSEYDELNMKRVESEVRSYQEKLERWMHDFRGIDRYVALHYLVQFAADHKKAPYALLEKAATLKAKGDLGLDTRLQAAGFNLVRYQVWRGQDYLDAYLEATKRYYGTKRQRERLEAEIRGVSEAYEDRAVSQ